MDNLVLIRVAAALDGQLAGAVFGDCREESAHRYRMLFRRDDRTVSVLVSLKPELPWIGRPQGRWPAERRSAGPFAGRCRRSLTGAVVRHLRKDAADRRVRLAFADGRSLCIELATHGANLILLDPRETVIAVARRPRKARARLVPGEPYQPPRLPRSLLNPFAADGEAIDAFLQARVAEGEPPLEALRRHVFGVGSEGARLVLKESASSGQSPGEVLLARIGALQCGALDPWIEATEDPLRAADLGRLHRDACRLLPWPGDSPAAGLALDDPAATAGLYHEALERAELLEARIAGLRAVLSRESERLFQAQQKAQADLAAFEDPERFRRWGEALLAGLPNVRTTGDIMMVPDPYDPAGSELAVPCRAGETPQQAAEEHFKRHRRARRGMEQASRRSRWLGEKLERLRAIERRQTENLDAGRVAELEQAMREQGIPVALEPPTRAGRAASRGSKPRLEGVRLLTSQDGLTILVGKSGRDNHRLTFKLTAPDDFWFHAQGCPGAHVAVRNPEGLSRPPEATLAQAAAAAAWFSEAREQTFADVNWTRRKYVRRPRGAALGTVVLKRFETIRVRPGLPAGHSEL